MAAEHYMIYLECPSTHGIQAGARGYKMSKKVWSSALAPLTTCDQVVQALYSEIASRLVVLINMIQMHRSNFTPLHWLLYTLSDECSTRVRTLHDKITEQALGVTLGVVQTLQGILQKLLPESSTPVLLVDELQQLAGRDVHNGVASMSLMKAVVQAAALLECAVVWSGTRMGVTAATSQHSGIAKHLENQQLSVVGEFEYLSTDRVKEYLERILSHTASPEMMNQLAYLLQGRARMLTGFIAALFTPDAEAMHCNSPLNDIVLSNTMEKYMETLVVDRFKMEIIGLGKLRGGKGIDYEDLGRIWFLTMLSNHLASTPAVEDTTNRDNSLAFTSRVFEVERTIDQAGKLGIDEPSVEYKFEYIYGEPGLQEALLRMVWQNRALADAGIRSVLRGAITGSTLGSYLDYAVALALISRRSSVLKDLCSGHRVFKRYAEYTLQISRVVCTNQADHQLEWFEKVIADPEDDTFSLLPGVPVRNIAILPSVLSGADIICVAVQGPLGGPPASPTASVPPPPDAQPSPPWTRRRARKLEELAVAPSAVIFAQFCCANYKGGVNSTKHLDQVIKSTDQFSATAERCIAGERYREVAKEHSDKYAYLPILVEIPQYDPDERDEYILITEQNAKVLFSQAVVEVFER